MLNKDQAIGALMLIVSIAGIIIYGWLLFFINALFVLQVSAFIAVVAILGILAWIGYTMATTPPPAPIEELTTAQPETSTMASQSETQEKSSS
jgi:predicted DNA-binding transcriptional regulator